MKVYLALEVGNSIQEELAFVNDILDLANFLMVVRFLKHFSTLPLVAPAILFDTS